MADTQPKIGLVLGGGGSRGLSHIGVIDVLEKNNIPVDIVVGTSMGAIIGVAYSLGISLDTIAEKLRSLQKPQLFNPAIYTARSRQALLRQVLETLYGDKTFADLDRPTVVTAVNLVTGKEVFLSEGALVPAVLASSSVPAVLPPFEMEDMLLGDGGIVDPLATQPAFEWGADHVIAVDVYPALVENRDWADPISALIGMQLRIPSASNIPNPLVALWRSQRVMATYLHQERLKHFPPDVLLYPPVDHYSLLDFTEMAQIIEAGRQTAQEHLAQIQALLE